VTHKEQIDKFINDILMNEPEGMKIRQISTLASLDKAGWYVLYDLSLQFRREEKQERAAGTATSEAGLDYTKAVAICI